MYDQFVILSVCRIAIKTNGKYVLSMVKYFLVMPTLTHILGFPGGSHGKESACSAGDPGLSLGGEDSLEGHGTHSSILAWRIPWTEKSGRGQYTESQRIGHY